ncbi:hypothetical protein KHP62_05655 [Rhodobacteraceae bacterium NNCM2]|nr:hypothetical protein [Coraliihabitans acroporae]
MTAGAYPWLDDLVTAVLVAEGHLCAVVTDGAAPPLLLRGHEARAVWYAAREARFIGGSAKTGWFEVAARPLAERPTGWALMADTGTSPAALAARATGPALLLGDRGAVIDGYAPIAEGTGLLCPMGSLDDPAIDAIRGRIAALVRSGDDLTDRLQTLAAGASGVTVTRLYPEGRLDLTLDPAACCPALRPGEVRDRILRLPHPALPEEARLAIPLVGSAACPIEIHLAGSGALPTAPGLTQSTTATGVVLAGAASATSPRCFEVDLSGTQGWAVEKVVLSLPVAPFAETATMVEDPLDAYDPDPFKEELFP